MEVDRAVASPSSLKEGRFKSMSGGHVMFARALVLISAIAMAPSASGALVSVATSFGASTGTLDTSSNLIWLDLSLSRPYSYDQINGVETQAGGQFEGYTLATQAQVNALIASSGIMAEVDGNALPAFIALANQLAGATDDISGDGCVLGVNAVADGFNSAGFVTTRIDQDGNAGCQSPTDDSGAFNTTLNPNLFGLQPDEMIVSHFPFIAGAWLVGPAQPIPASSTLSLVALAIPLLIRRLRR